MKRAPLPCWWPLLALLLAGARSHARDANADPIAVPCPHTTADQWAWTQQITREGLRPAELAVSYAVSRVQKPDGDVAFDVLVTAAADALAPSSGSLVHAGPLRVPIWGDGPPIVTFSPAQAEALAEAATAMQPALAAAKVPAPMQRYLGVTFAKLELLLGFGPEGMLTPAHYACRSLSRRPMRYQTYALQFYGHYGVSTAGRVRVREKDGSITIRHDEHARRDAKATLFTHLRRQHGDAIDARTWAALRRRPLKVRLRATTTLDAATGVVRSSTAIRELRLLGVRQQVTVVTTLAD